MTRAYCLGGKIEGIPEFKFATAYRKGMVSSFCYCVFVLLGIALVVSGFLVKDEEGQ